MKKTHYPRAISHIWCFLLLAVLAPTSMASETPVNLGSAGSFAILAYTTVTNTNSAGCSITGDLGVSPGTSVTGFPPGVVIGQIHAGDPAAAQAKLDLTTAYNDAAGRTTAPATVAGNLGGMTLYPGLYKSTSSLAISSGDLTLDAQGDPNAVFIFQIASTLTTTSGRQVILAGGAQPSKIFWQVGSSATFGTTSVFYGIILAHVSITLNTGATLTGRALAETGAVTLDVNELVAPPVGDEPLDTSQCFCVPDWQFNQSDYPEGWINNANLTPFTVNSGMLNTSTTGLNPQMISQTGLDINADYQTEVKIRMRVSSGTQASLSFRSPTDVGFNPTKQFNFTIPNNSSFVTYNLDMKEVFAWTGALDQLRFKPSNQNGAVVDIDYFSVCLPVVVKAPNWEFDTNGDTEGWRSNTSIPDIAAAGGFLTGKTTGTNGRFISPANFSVNADVQTQLVIRMRVTAGTSFQVQFMRSEDIAFLPANALNVPITNHSFYVNYVVDLSTRPTYTGTINRFAIKVSNSALASVSIDYFRVCMPFFDFTPSATFNTDGNAEGWLAGGNSSPLVVSDGYLETTSTGIDPQLIAPVCAVDTRFSRFFMCALQISSGSFFDVYYRQFGDPGFTGAKKKNRKLVTNVDRRLYSVDLGTLPNYEAWDLYRLRLDPASAPGVNTKIDFMGMLDQTMEVGYASEFNRNGNLEGWVANADLASATVAQGILSATSTGTDPSLVSRPDLFINADNEKQVVIRMKVSAGSIGTLYYKRAIDSTFTAVRSKIFNISSNTDFVTYNLDMSLDPNWSGLVDRLRLDPTADNGASVKWDLLETYGPVQTGTPEWRWSEDGDLLGWTAASNVGSLSVAGSILTVTSSGVDPAILSPAGLGINADGRKWLIIKMKVSAAPGNLMDLLYKRVTDAGFASTRRIRFTTLSNTDYVTYKIKMTTDPNWTGTIDQFRLHPSRLSSSVSKLDYILVP